MQRILFLSIQTRVDRGRLRRSAQRTHEDIARTGADGGGDSIQLLRRSNPRPALEQPFLLYMLYSPGFRRRKLKS